MLKKLSQERASSLKEGDNPASLIHELLAATTVQVQS
jgi:hypothetical protein